MFDRNSAERVASVVLAGITEGKPVEIDGLGIFYPDSDHGFRFEPSRRPQVFIAYVTEDAPLARRLFNSLRELGYNPWMDAQKLMPGQNWPRAIDHAIETSDFFLACFSQNSVSKKGGFQSEIRYALDCARHLPLDDVFVIPVRLNECGIPRSIQRELQYVDMFPDWRRGLRRLNTVMRRGRPPVSEARG